MPFLEKAVWVFWVLALIAGWGAIGHADRMDNTIRIGLGLLLFFALLFSVPIVGAIVAWVQSLKR